MFVSSTPPDVVARVTCQGWAVYLRTFASEALLEAILLAANNRDCAAGAGRPATQMLQRRHRQWVENPPLSHYPRQVVDEVSCRHQLFGLGLFPSDFQHSNTFYGDELV